jgi:indole-3-glycerol phosphate synthase
MPSILDTIVAAKREELSSLPPGPVGAHRVRDAILARHDGVRDLARALRHPARGDVALIAEVKKASPSKGIIRADFDPVRIAVEYEQAGASCLSVLTDRRFFHGSLEYLRAIRSAVRLPLLRKDFVIDERQVLEAAEWGADAILLIVAILDDEALRHLLALAEASGLAALVEVHDEAELARALAAGARLVGVNNRDLRTFTVDLGTTGRIAARLHAADAGREVLLVAESGIESRADVACVRDSGAKAILVGESLMRAASIRDKAGELLGIA